ncbi:MAG TPA: hypothetical protein VG758_31230, partial [Hyphomicrobiaceae bacterium]|nr:hypothetical protein [Hyphomicrobiaceae bacterium]
HGVSCRRFRSLHSFKGQCAIREDLCGNAPNFPQIAKFPDERIVVLKTREMSLLSKWDNADMVALETLIVRQVEPTGWPRFVHAWTTPTAPDKPLAQKILLSLKVEEK